MAESISYQIAGINNQITDEFGSDNDLEVTGGGRGWTATTTIGGVVRTVRHTSRLGAAEALYALIAAEDETDDETDSVEEEFENCRDECQASERDYCECSCGGANHGVGLPNRHAVMLLGKKDCACGCGGSTLRKYVPGHDARHHARLRAIEGARAAGVSVEEFLTAKKKTQSGGRKR